MTGLGLLHGFSEVRNNARDNRHKMAPALLEQPGA